LSGDVAAREQNTATALASWNTVLAADSANRRVLGKIAHLHHTQRDWQQEDAILTRMIALQEDGATLARRSICRRRMHRWSEAQDDLRRARAFAPEDADVRRAAELLDRLTPFLSAIRALDARLAVTPGDDQLLADRALFFLRGEDAELALEDSEAAAKAAPWAMRPRLFQAIALRALERQPEAEKVGVVSDLRLNVLTPEFLETIGRLDSEISVERRNAELYVARAWQLNEINQPKLALEDAEMAQELDEKSAAACVEGSYALAKLGRTDDAIAQIKRATELDANHATAWHYRGELEMSVGDHSAAVESLTRALAINQTPDALQKREECYVKLGLLAKAEEDHRAREALSGNAATP
jgi:tetratricopeptide (TPR) repeat protein